MNSSVGDAVLCPTCNGDRVEAIGCELLPCGRCKGEGRVRAFVRPYTADEICKLLEHLVYERPGLSAREAESLLRRLERLRSARVALRDTREHLRRGFVETALCDLLYASTLRDSAARELARAQALAPRRRRAA